MDNTWSTRRLRPRGSAAATPAATVEPTPSRPRKTQPKKKGTTAKKPPAPKVKPAKAPEKKQEVEPRREEETKPQQEELAQAQDESPAREASPLKEHSPPQERQVLPPIPRLSPPAPRQAPVVRLSAFSTPLNVADPAGNGESPQRSTEITPPSSRQASSSHHGSSSETVQDDTPIRRPDPRFGVPLTVDTPDESTLALGRSPSEQIRQEQWARLHDERPRDPPRERPLDEELRFRGPARPTFLESTPKVVSQPAIVEQETLHELPIHRAQRVKRCLSSLAGLILMIILSLSLLLVIEDAHRFRNVEEGEMLLLPIHQPVLDLSNVLMDFSPSSSMDRLLKRSSEYIDSMCQGPSKWEELRAYKKPPSVKWENPRKAKARSDNMTRLFLSSAKDDKGMRAVVNMCSEVKELIKAISKQGPSTGTAQKMALQDTARVMEEIQARLTTTAPQGDGFTDLKGNILGWIRPGSRSNQTTPWQHQQQVMSRYLLSLDKLGKDVTKAFEDVPVEEPTSGTGTSGDANLLGGHKRMKSVPVWRRWVRHPLGSSLELAHLFKNNALDFSKLSIKVSDIETHMTESCQNRDATKQAGCPYSWPPSDRDRPTLDLEAYSVSSRDRARKIAGALDWIDLQRQVLRAVVKIERSKGPGLLDGECEIVLDSTKEGTGALISTRGWIHPDPMANRGQLYSSLPICAPTRVFRPSMEKLDCKLPGSDDYWHDVWNMMGHTFGLTSRFENEISWIRDTNDDSHSVSQRARDVLWRHDLMMSQKASVWTSVMDQVPHPRIQRLRDSFFWGTSSPMRGIRLPSVEDQDYLLKIAVSKIRMFMWQYT
ncbi:unnamed protein product [Clonostachys rosea]|uniref:SUN domain-containing protein n=1 Tax=Bionectria ochroleuca TaxID=29856 RepID=A0ABY6UPS6_BIOOC|nr:unnamed protein product [Clonostachys rosea]